MIKALFILGVLIGLLSFAYIVMTASPSDKKQYEAYQRWKERKKLERELEHLGEMLDKLENWKGENDEQVD